MAPQYTATVTGTAKSPTRLDVQIRDFSVTIDEPASLGGDDTGPNPVELVLSGLAGCLNITTHMVAKERGIEVRSLSVTATGSLNPQRLMGRPTPDRAGFQGIRLEIDVDADASPEEIDALLLAAEERCCVADNLMNATPVSVVRAGATASAV
ncbi:MULTISPECIES: OsmC family protein [Oerskovia]|uniref:OsmC family protein n=2 Tax=Oerskovia TaxID=162491 RepID=A0ABR8V714_9CELL|nr:MULTISPECIES: OsmC family protein [Oerskovia]MBD8000569.1 OsmC family protein [Oerskovia gallyi]MBM7496179.1 putative OsmC-like protein [Oerskovia paurometabola]